MFAASFVSARSKAQDHTIHAAAADEAEQALVRRVNTRGDAFAMSLGDRRITTRPAADTALFENGPLDEPLRGARLTNTALLRAVEALAVMSVRGGGRRRVDFEHLGAEELGSVYESLLEMRPRWDPSKRQFHLERLAGNERKTTGSYYTPSSLVECLLDSAFDPLLDEAQALPKREDRIAALLDITVCDTACGSRPCQ